VTLTTRALAAGTWPDFAALVEANDGVWGGCWCMGFHLEGVGRAHHTVAGNRAAKERRVRDGEAHAALVYDGDTCVGWCQFGPPDELPNIKSRKQYDATDDGTVADWRITCFFVGKGHRKRGVADTALAGALGEIARLGGGVVESYPEDTTDRKVSGSFLMNGTLAMFERHGFTRDRKIAKDRWVVRKKVRRSQR
jgi:GNAT superfamily N-acetyltransferase